MHVYGLDYSGASRLSFLVRLAVLSSCTVETDRDRSCNSNASISCTTIPQTRVFNTINEERSLMAPDTCVTQVHSVTMLFSYTLLACTYTRWSANPLRNLCNVDCPQHFWEGPAFSELTSYFLLPLYCFQGFFVTWFLHPIQPHQMCQIS